MNSTPDRPWRGVLVATALPLRAEDLSVDYEAYAAHCAWLVANGCDGVVPNGSLGEYQVLTPRSARGSWRRPSPRSAASASYRASPRTAPARRAAGPSTPPTPDAGP